MAPQIICYFFRDYLFMSNLSKYRYKNSFRAAARHLRNPVLRQSTWKLAKSNDLIICAQMKTREKEKEKERERERERERDRERQTDRQTNRQTEKEKNFFNMFLHGHFV
jgi:hypothetical protein